METFANFVSTIDSWLWGPWLLILLFGTHLYLTVRTGFIQKNLGLGIKLSMTKDAAGEGEVSQFASLTTALASTIGIGNIIGVGTAIAFGGPGAMLWMWLTGVFGIASRYCESLIAVKYRVKNENGAMLGGTMFALERGLKNKKIGRCLAILFALFTGLAAFGIGATTQSNAVAGLVFKTFSVPTWVTGLVLMLFAGLVIIGGLKWISKVCQVIVPLMSLIYVLGCLIILALNAQYIGTAISTILSAAFTPHAVGGGLAGYGIMAAARFGIARGLFSNESGMGSAPIVASAAKTANPVRQALVSMTGTFWDTVVICLITGLVIVTYEVASNGSSSFQDGVVLVHEAFSSTSISDSGETFAPIPIFGSIILNFGLFFFAFSTILGWSYYGERGAEYLFGTKIIIPYRVFYTVLIFVGATIPLLLVWDIADALNALMILPNIVAMLLLSGVIVAETKKYGNAKHIDDVDTDTVPFLEEVRKSERYSAPSKLNSPYAVNEIHSRD